MKLLRALVPFVLIPAALASPDSGKPGDAGATQAAAVPATPAKPRDYDLFVIGFGEYRPGAEMNNGASGSVRRTVWDGEVVGFFKPAENLRVNLDYEAKWTHNDFRDTPAPYGDTESHFFGVNLMAMFDKTWGAGLVGGMELAAETHADLLGDGLRGGGGPCVIWNPSDTFTTETGILLQSQFGRDAIASPFIRWKWAVSKNVELETRATGLQNGFAGTWYITDNKATSLRVSLFYETSNYALRDGAPAAGVFVAEVPLRFTFTQFLTEHFFVAARIEATLFHREAFYRDDEKLASFQTGVAPVFGLMAGFKL